MTTLDQRVSGGGRWIHGMARRDWERETEEHNEHGHEMRRDATDTKGGILDVGHAPGAPGRGPCLLCTRTEEFEEQDGESDGGGDGIQQSFWWLSQRHLFRLSCWWMATVSKGRVRVCVRAAQDQKRCQLSKFRLSGPIFMEAPLGGPDTHSTPPRSLSHQTGSGRGGSN